MNSDTQSNFTNLSGLTNIKRGLDGDSRNYGKQVHQDESDLSISNNNKSAMNFTIDEY